MVPSRQAQKSARRRGGTPPPTGPRERDTKGANDAKQRRKVEPADLDAARRTSEDAMRRLSTQDKDDLPQAAARPAPVAEGVNVLFVILWNFGHPLEFRP